MYGQQYHDLNGGSYKTQNTRALALETIWAVILPVYPQNYAQCLARQPPSEEALALVEPQQEDAHARPAVHRVRAKQCHSRPSPYAVAGARPQDRGSMIKTEPVQFILCWELHP